MSHSTLWLTALLCGAMLAGADTHGQPAGTPSRATVLTTARAIMVGARCATFTTLDDQGAPLSRIVDPFPPEDELTIWIGTNARTRKVAQIARDGRVTLTYFEPKAQHYVTIVGAATLVRDLAARTKRWKDDWKAFYPDGPGGDGYVLIRVEPVRVEVVAPSLGIDNDPVTWRPTTIDMRR